MQYKQRRIDQPRRHEEKDFAFGRAVVSMKMSDIIAYDSYRQQFVIASPPYIARMQFYRHPDYMATQSAAWDPHTTIKDICFQPWTNNCVVTFEDAVEIYDVDREGLLEVATIPMGKRAQLRSTDCSPGDGSFVVAAGQHVVHFDPRGVRLRSNECGEEAGVSNLRFVHGRFHPSAASSPFVVALSEGEYGVSVFDPRVAVGAIKPHPGCLATMDARSVCVDMKGYLYFALCNASRIDVAEPRMNFRLIDAIYTYFYTLNKQADDPGDQDKKKKSKSQHNRFPVSMCVDHLDHLYVAIYNQVSPLKYVY